MSVAEATQKTPITGVLQERLFVAAVASLLVLISGTLLYPDTFASAGFNIGPFRASPLSMLFIIAAPAVLLNAWVNRHFLTMRILDVMLLAMTTFFTVRGLLATDEANLAGLTLAVAAYSLLLYYGTAVAGNSSLMRKGLFITLSCLAVIVSAYALIEYFLSENIIFGEIIRESVPIPRWRTFHRSGSTLGHPAALGIFLIQVAPFLVYFFGKARSWSAKIVLIAALVLLTLALETTFTKGSWGTAIILAVPAALWCFWRYKSARKPIVALLTATLLSVAVFTIFYSDDVSSGVFSKSRKVESFVTRDYMWSRTPTVFLAHPLFGVGMWQGGDEVAAIDPIEEWGETGPTSIDNQYLVTLVEQGLVGFMLLGGVMVLIARQAWTMIRAGGEQAQLVVPLAFSMSAVLINGMTANTLLIWPAMVLFWASAGLLRAMYEMSGSPSPGI